MSTAVKEKPIRLYSHEVRAVLDGRQTMLRRVVKPQPREKQLHVGRKDYSGQPLTPDDIGIGRCHYSKTGWAYDHAWHVDGERGCFCVSVPCPYEVGMRLWIKTGYTTRYDARFDQTIWSLPGGVFFVTHGRAYSKSGRTKRDGGHPAMFMPHWLSQELSLPALEVTDVRVERVQEISEANARAEGVESQHERARDAVEAIRSVGFKCNLDDRFLGKESWVGPFRQLWDSINASRPGCAWADNPWVWVVEFRSV